MKYFSSIIILLTSLLHNVKLYFKFLVQKYSSYLFLLGFTKYE